MVLNSARNRTAPTPPTTAPSTCLGVMGGGQLGRMFAHAAQAMGFKVVVLEPTAECPAGQVADDLVCADYEDVGALTRLAQQCSAVTTEFENVPANALRELARDTFVAPSAACVAIAQDRMAEKRFFSSCVAQTGIHPAPHYLIEDAADLSFVPTDLLPGLLKTLRLGYDGKGQIRVATVDELARAFKELGSAPCVLEKRLSLSYEVSVLVARGADGHAVVYPIAENVHRNGILHVTSVPSGSASSKIAEKVQAAALTYAAQLEYVGVLCIEFFVLDNEQIVVNEMAPRPHNSGHYSMDACVTSQFAQQVRAMARIPLGEARQHSPAVMLNLLGDLWFDEGGSVPSNSREPAWEKILALPGACLHLYGKEQARPGRKMGHVTFVAPTMAQATTSLHAACAILGIAP